MDLAGAITNLQTAKAVAGVQLSVARKLLQTQGQSGNAAVKLIEAADRGTSLAGDQLAAQAIGLGGLLDMIA
jgi:hypothetical protein